MQLSRGRYGWWCRADSDRVALLPGEMVDRGNLVPAAERDLREGGFYDRPRRDTYYLTVLTSTTCNLGCAYCFQNVGPPPQGTSRPPRIPHRSLDRATILSLLEFSDERMVAAGTDKLDILLFGGEPLLNSGGCLDLLAEAAAHGLAHAEVVTNGVLLTPALAQSLEAVGLRRVQITFDGDRDDHDQIRVTRRGQKTFDRILANIVAVSECTELPWSFRVNVSERTAHGVARLIERLSQQVDPGRCSINFALIEDVGIGYTNAWGPSPETADTFSAWNVKALDLGFSVPFYKPITECVYCSQANGEVGAVINADGTLYSCWEAVGKPGWDVGDIRSGYVVDPDVLASRWVACDYDAVEHSSASEDAAFKASVDAAKLDWLYEHHHLDAVC